MTECGKYRSLLWRRRTGRQKRGNMPSVAGWTLAACGVSEGSPGCSIIDQALQHWRTIFLSCSGRRPHEIIQCDGRSAQLIFSCVCKYSNMKIRTRIGSREESLWLSLFAVSFLLPWLRHKLWMMKIWRVRSPMILLEMTEGQHECLRHFAQDSRSPEICHRDRLLKRLDPRFLSLRDSWT